MPNRTSDGHHDGPRFPGVILMGEMDGLPGRVKVSGLAPKRTMTPGQRRRLRRDTLIHLGSENGFTHAALADVFDLPKSRIYSILLKPPSPPWDKP